MAESNTKSENLPQKPIETVRVIVKDKTGNILLLKKSDKSIAKGFYEFPGGKIDEISGSTSSLSEQIDTAKKELEQEAGIPSEGLSFVSAGEFEYEIGKNPEYNNLRMVHVFVTEIKSQTPLLLVGQTKDANGEPEDFHDNYLWVTREELDKLKSDNKLLGNTANYEDYI